MLRKDTEYLSILTFALLFTHLSLFSAANTLSKCELEQDFPSIVTVAGIQVVSPLDAEYWMFDVATQAAEVGLQLFNEEQMRNGATIVQVEWHRQNITLQDDQSATEVMKATLDMFDYYQAERRLTDRVSHDDMKNLVAVTGGMQESWTEAINLVANLYGYPHLDITEGPGMSDVNRFPMFSRFLSSSLTFAKVYLEFLRYLNVKRVAAIFTAETQVEAAWFYDYADVLGIEIVCSGTLDSTVSEELTREIINEIKEQNVHYVVLFVDERFAAFLAHWYLAGLDDIEEGRDEYEIVWMGQAVTVLHMYYSMVFQNGGSGAPQILLQWYQKYPVFGDPRLGVRVLSAVFGSMKGSFGAINADYRQDPEEDYVSQYYAERMWLRGVFPAGADIGLTVGMAVRDMINSGLGCHLHARAFTHAAAQTLHEFIISQKFRGNSGWVEFDSNGDRLWSVEILSFHPGYPEDQMDEFFFHTASILPNFPVAIAIFNSAAEITRFSSRVIIWPSGNSSTEPGSAPWDGFVETSLLNVTNTETIVHIAESSKYPKYFFWVVGMASFGLVAVLIMLLVLWHRYRGMKTEYDELVMDVQERKFDVAAPIEKVSHLIQGMLKGTLPSKTELLNLQELLSHGSIMAPNLETQILSCTNLSMNNLYSEDSLGYVMDSTVRHRVSRCGNAPRQSWCEEMNGNTVSRELSVALSNVHSEVTKQYKVWTFYHSISEVKAETARLTSEVGRIICSNSIDLYSLANGRPLAFVAMQVLDNRFHLVSTMRLIKQKLVAFLTIIEDGYRPLNPYHNNTHAADVTNRFSAIVYQCKLHQGVLTDEELLAGIIAAIIHDYQHPGTNNAFQEAAGTRVAKQFNDISVLENASLVTALDLLDMPQTSFLEDLPHQQLHNIRKLIIHAVLATDLSDHFNVLSKFNTKIVSEPFQPSKNVDAEQRRLLLKMALKCADLGHTTLDLENHLIWVKSLQEEFYRQGDRERELELPVSFLMDRTKPRNGPAHGEQQLGFFDIVCAPMYQAWVDRFPSCQILMTRLEENRQFWKLDAIQQQKVAARISQGCSSASLQRISESSAKSLATVMLDC